MSTCIFAKQFLERDEMTIFKRPKLQKFPLKREMKGGDLWQKCPSCEGTLHTLDLKRNLFVCPKCNYHFPINAKIRIKYTVDEGSFEQREDDLQTANPLDFENYSEKIEKLKEKTSMNEAVICGKAKISTIPVILCIMDFSFFAGSMGSVVGEKITRSIEIATKKKLPLIIFSCSSGARMQEGIFSLMQMAKTCGALKLHAEAKLPYISVLTHPTTGGVSASFAMLGDINLAEPKCMIGFAGPRVIKATTHQDLPKGFQTAEFMLEHGSIDSVVNRSELPQHLKKLLNYMHTK